MSIKNPLTKDEYIDRFLSRVDKRAPGGCWIWQGAKDRRGYGMFSNAVIDSNRAHRFSFAVFVEPIVDGNVICHRCDVPACVNPEHLFQGSDAENMLDAISKGRLSRQQRADRKAEPNERSKVKTQQIKDLREELARAREEIEMLRDLVRFLSN